ncbi:hypothetical protein CWI75_03070 [Kineobactrum sediminis]|uniref:Glycosyltransferase n=1 Tax=Kineobactrum sediminis TaxID=1905677 RepID=A0A2N5Y7G7_9GAMM|nr:MJ1255/VC2487 family glycosyltransferase [Kineobactrum sediminis]PLW84336.1 hypothetical protein CWI75_03070 [Kineobactrum sediminis]
MKILYGVQGTGNGHISRARAMTEALAAHDVEVTWLFSGRERHELFDMAPFGDFLHRRGLTFISRAGRIDYGRTLIHNNLWRFLRDVRTLPLAGFDAVVTDFEPITAWAGRRAGLPVIGIGHQYALGDTAPTVAGHWLARQVMNRFAPVTRPLGLHWYPYADNVLPPILHLPDRQAGRSEDIVVYLPFEEQPRITGLLQQFPQYRFRQYASGLAAMQVANVLLCPTSTNNFKRDLAQCAGVICNSGFELISECLQWRKPVLTRPLQGQIEQLSNARALDQLGYATVTNTLCPVTLGQWLEHRPAPPMVEFPDVAACLARWLADGAGHEMCEMQRWLWLEGAGTGIGQFPRDKVA